MNTTTYRIRLVKAGSGSKLHVMRDRSEDGGQTWFVGSHVGCGSSPYAPRTILQAIGATYSEARENLKNLVTTENVSANLCQRCFRG
jgi:hypothetical protein